VQFIPVDNVYVYFRKLKDEAVMVIINNSLESKSIEMKNYAEILKQYTKGFEIINETKFDLNSGSFECAGKNSYIIELTNE
jgi:hypothetical protein